MNVTRSQPKTLTIQFDVTERERELLRTYFGRESTEGFRKRVSALNPTDDEAIELSDQLYEAFKP